MKIGPLPARHLVLLLGAPSLSALLLLACVGEDPKVGSPDAAGSPEASAEDRGTPPPPPPDSSAPDAGGDAAMTCPGKLVPCGSVCTDLSSSNENCGACGKSCGGGICTNSACGVAVVRDNIAKLNGLAVDDASLYFTDADKVFSCPLDACTTPPKQLAAMIAYDAQKISVDSGFIYFESAPNQATQRPNIYRCPIAGCPNPPTSIAADGLNGIRSFLTFQKSMYANLGGSGINRVDCSSGACSAGTLVVTRPVEQFAVDAQRVYFNDTTGGSSQLSSCPLTTACTTRTTLTQTRILGDIAVTGNLVYFVGPGITTGAAGVFACPTATACATPTVLTKTAGEIPNLAVDGSGIFWTEEDKLMSCPSVGCPGGPRTIASGLSSVGLLRLDTKFAYFRTNGTTAGTSAIKRVARP